MKILAAILVALLGVLIALAAVLASTLKRNRKPPPEGDEDFEGAEEASDFPDDPDFQENQRRHLRVSYPDRLRPMLRIRKHRLPVVDISERGLCFLNTRNIRLAKWVRGEITLQMGLTLVVEGQVVREQEEAVGLSLITPIPYKDILTEARLVASHNEN